MKHLEGVTPHVTLAPLKKRLDEPTIVVTPQHELRRPVGTSPPIDEATLQVDVSIYLWRHEDPTAELDRIAEIVEDRLSILPNARLKQVSYSYDQSTGDTLAATTLGYELTYNCIPTPRTPRIPTLEEVTIAYSL